MVKRNKFFKKTIKYFDVNADYHNEEHGCTFCFLMELKGCVLFFYS